MCHSLFDEVNQTGSNKALHQTGPAFWSFGVSCLPCRPGWRAMSFGNAAGCDIPIPSNTQVSRDPRRVGDDEGEEAK